MVDDQDKALKFCTEVLQFRKKHDIPVGQYKWLTVVSPEGPGDIELSLEPNANPAAKTFQEAMFAQSIPLAAFEAADIEGEYARPWRRLYARTDPHGQGNDRGVLRYLRQSNSVVSTGVKQSACRPTPETPPASAPPLPGPGSESHPSQSRPASLSSAVRKPRS
jgi:hypothetical protein